MDRTTIHMQIDNNTFFGVDAGFISFSEATQGWPTSQSIRNELLRMQTARIRQMPRMTAMEEALYRYEWHPEPVPGRIDEMNRRLDSNYVPPITHLTREEPHVDHPEPDRGEHLPVVEAVSLPQPEAGQERLATFAQDVLASLSNIRVEDIEDSEDFSDAELAIVMAPGFLQHQDKQVGDQTIMVAWDTEIIPFEGKKKPWIVLRYLQRGKFYSEMHGHNRVLINTCCQIEGVKYEDFIRKILGREVCLYGDWPEMNNPANRDKIMRRCLEIISREHSTRPCALDAQATSVYML